MGIVVIIAAIWSAIITIELFFQSSSRIDDYYTTYKRKATNSKGHIFLAILTCIGIVSSIIAILATITGLVWYRSPDTTHSVILFSLVTSYIIALILGIRHLIKENPFKR